MENSRTTPMLWPGLQLSKLPKNERDKFYHKAYAQNII